MCKSLNQWVLQFITLATLIEFFIIYLLIYEKNCNGKDPEEFFENPSLPILILLCQFIYYMIVICIVKCREKGGANKCCSTLIVIIIITYSILDLVFAGYIIAYQSDCGMDAYLLALSSLWCSVWSIILATITYNVLKSGRGKADFTALEQDDQTDIEDV